MDIYARYIETHETHAFLQLRLNKSTASSKTEYSKDSMQCSECGQVFYVRGHTNKRIYEKHMKEHYYKNFKCDCNETFATIREKMLHVKIKHEMRTKRIKCEHCNYYCSQALMLKHMMTIHTADLDSKWVCSICGKGLAGEKAFNRHQVVVHKEVDCKICGIVLTGSGRLRAHIRESHPDVPKTELKRMEFACDMCDRTFPFNSTLKVHKLRCHTEEKDRPFQCELCVKGFALRVELKTHIRTQHTKTQPYKCRFACGSAYNTSSSRRKHERVHHGAILPRHYTTPTG